MFNHPVLPLGQKANNTDLINSRRVRSKSQKNMKGNKQLKSLDFWGKNIKKAVVFVYLLSDELTIK